MLPRTPGWCAGNLLGTWQLIYCLIVSLPSSLACPLLHLFVHPCAGNASGESGSKGKCLFPQWLEDVLQGAEAFKPPSTV